MSQTHHQQDVVELQAPDISAYRQGNTGVEYITTYDSGRAGPHVMISAVVHGNEICGAIALDHLFQTGIRPLLGRLSLAFMNVDAYLSFDPQNPRASRCVEEDFNRLWDERVLAGARDSVECRRARQVWPVVDTVDFLLDIHSMSNVTEALMIAGPEAKGRQLSQALGLPRTVVSDAGHAAGKRMRDYRPFVDPSSARNALLIECGQHWEKSSAEVAIDSAYRFLAHFGLIDRETKLANVRCEWPEAQRFIQVSGPETIQSDAFAFTQAFVGMEVISKAGTLIAHDGEREVRTPYDNAVLIMPTRKPKKGESALRYGQYIPPT